MHTRNTSIFLLIIFFAFRSGAQLSFTINVAQCSGDTKTLTANTGTLTALAYTWAALPSGPVFSAPGSATTTVNFPAAGTFTIGLGILTMSGLVYTTNTLVVTALPVFTIAAASVSSCPGSTAGILAGSTNTNLVYTFSSPSATVSLGNSAVFNFSTTQTYTVSANEAGCKSTQTITIHEGSVHPFLASSASLVCAGMPVILYSFGGASSSFTFYQMPLTPGPSVTIPSAPFSSSVPINPTESAIYSVLVDSAGCHSALPLPTIVINVRLPLNLTVTASAMSVCPGMAATLTVAGPTLNTSTTLYTWVQASGAGTFAPVVSQTAIAFPVTNSIYSVTALDSLGCTGSASLNILIDPLISFPLQVSASSSVLCLGQTATLNVTGTLSTLGSLTFSWSSGTGFMANGPTVVVSQTLASTYLATGSNGLGCVAFSQVQIEMGCVGLNELQIQSFNIYPNPANEGFYISSELLLPLTYEIIDASGKILISRSVPVPGLKGEYVDLSDLLPGFYGILVNGNSADQKFFKLVKN